jgi:hypothetical protein
VQVRVGVNYRGLSFFDAKGEPYLSYQYFEVGDVNTDRTRLHISLNSGEQVRRLP